MAKVICTLPNASGLIGNVKFVSHRDGMISEEISIEQAKRFCSIPGYQLAGAPVESEVQPKDTGKKREPKKKDTEKKETEKPGDPPGDKDPDAKATGIEAPVSTGDAVTSTDPALPSGSEPSTQVLTPTF